MRPAFSLALPALACAFALAGCATRAPQVQADGGVAVPPAWAQPLPAPGGMDAPWWNAFGDATLAELVEQASRTNTTVAAALANLRQARALRDAAVAGGRPNVSAGATAQRARPSGTGSSSNLFNAGLDASWEVDLFGATAHEIAAQEALVRSSAAALASTRVSVAAETALAYLDLRSAQVRTAVARENLASQEETLQITRWRQQAGLASSLQVEQALATVEQTRAAIPSLQAAAAAAAHALGVLTGQPPQALLQRLAASAPLPQAGPRVDVAVPAEVLRRRPDVLASEEQLLAAAERVAQADAQRLPTATLRASLAWSGVTLGSLGGVAAARSLVASLAQPIFDGGLRNAQLAASEAEFESARQALRASVLAALQDVENALVAVATTKERLASLQLALDAARNASLLATQRYASGLIDFQTVLETQRTLLNVQDSVAGAQAQLATDHVRLFKALGGGWRPANAEVS